MTVPAVNTSANFGGARRAGRSSGAQAELAMARVDTAAAIALVAEWEPSGLGGRLDCSRAYFILWLY